VGEQRAERVRDDKWHFEDAIDRDEEDGIVVLVFIDLVKDLTQTLKHPVVGGSNAKNARTPWLTRDAKCI
jgi:hypothetical protein